MGFRRASEDSILAVQIFDQKKFKKKDQGFLGVINVRVGDVVDFSSGQDRKLGCFDSCLPWLTLVIHRNAHTRPQEIYRQLGRSWKADHQLVYKPF